MIIQKKNQPNLNKTFADNWFNCTDRILDLCISDAIWQMKFNTPPTVDHMIYQNGEGEIVLNDKVICKYESKNNIITTVYANEKY